MSGWRSPSAPTWRWPDVTPKLVLPNLSGVNEGPGFPNLSCLGLLSDRVLGAELAAPDPPMGRSGEYQSV